MFRWFLRKSKDEKPQSFDAAEEVHTIRRNELKKVSYALTGDEEVVCHFLTDIDRDFGSRPMDRVRQGNHFEQFLAAVFRLAGYKVEITKKSRIKENVKMTGDGGVDLILTTAHERIAVQAKSKRLNSKSTDMLITEKDIKLFSGISDENWTKKMFISTTFFNKYVYEQIATNEKAQKIEWYDRYGLIKLLNTLIPETMLKYQLLRTMPESTSVCPKCTQGVVVNCWSKKTKRDFKACSLFCGYIENINQGKTFFF